MPDFPDEAEVTGEAHGEKVALRAVLLARRRALPAPDRAAAAALVQAELTDLVRRSAPGRVTAYVPVGSEPGGPDLPDRLLEALAVPAGPVPGAPVPDARDLAAPDRGGELLLPVLRADLDLDWARYTGVGADGGALVAAGRGLREPAGARLGTDVIGTAALVIVPALAVDRRGIRLGRGGGSYDRALARVAPGVLTVALLHDGELVDRVPAQPHDRPVRAVITPSDGFRLLSTG
ncbi:5-formyltetrahydrofolate cyclo-ligase [Micromonospora sp. NPDC049523]|uniref:5-formyltetrahydrofolate cyclo-ligase n=1 Tax=Micromonospora sp. NPDC049523 TaxID=3155921 RepID=UPI00341AC751